MSVRVEIEGGRLSEVRVRERAPIITVMFKVAQTCGITLTANSALFELSDSLKICTVNTKLLELE